MPLSALLSRALVAFTIEFDNEFEHRMPHRTSNHGSTGDLRNAPWLVSLAMWSNCMQFVGPDGIAVREMERLAHTTTNLAGMQRWGYITVVADPSDVGPKPPASDWIVRATAAGKQAQDVWRPLFDVIEQRWYERFGTGKIIRLREALWAVTRKLDMSLPDCMPILGYGLFSKVSGGERQAPGEHEAGNAADHTLIALLSKVLLANALDFESESDVSLAISANILRLTGEAGVRVRDLPRLAGASKEAVAMAMSFLEKHGYATTMPEAPGSRVKALVLTPKGQQARDRYRQLVETIEERWCDRFGETVVDHLRDSLEQVVAGPTAWESLMRGIEPYPEGWRASVPRSEELPHFPMVLHRGGFPDGS